VGEPNEQSPPPLGTIVLSDIACAAFVRRHGHELRGLEGGPARVLFVFDGVAQEAITAFNNGGSIPAKDFAREIQMLHKVVRLRREQTQLDERLREPIAASAGGRG
jgi:hypothetical protein